MTAEFDFQRVQTSLSTIVIEDIGNTTIVAVDDRHMEYYLSIRTDLGWTEILSYGASSPDIEQLPNSVTVKYQRIPYNERKIQDTIQKFLNPGQISFTSAEEIEREDLVNLTRNIVEDFVNGTTGN